MKTLYILGTGCPKCQKLAEVTQEAIDELSLECEIEKITDLIRFADFGVMVTPALVIEGKVKVNGKIPSLEEMKNLLATT